jgi:hypothetical protein
VEGTGLGDVGTEHDLTFRMEEGEKGIEILVPRGEDTMDDLDGFLGHLAAAQPPNRPI